MRRYELHDELVSILGSNNVYFQPPESIKIKYPCFIYNLDKIDTKKASSTLYKADTRYSLTYISTDPDNDMASVLLKLPYCAIDTEAGRIFFG